MIVNSKISNVIVINIEFLISASSSTRQRNSTSMERSTCWTFLVTLVISLWHFQTSEACSCLYQHSQTHFCNSDFFAVVNVTRADDINEVSYADVHEIFKATEGALNILEKKPVQLKSSDSMCGYFLLTPGKTWVVSGTIVNNKISISPCGFAQLWSTITPLLRENFRNFYHSGCLCHIWDNQRRHNSRFESPGRMTCVLDSSLAPRVCQERYGICVPNSRNDRCFWMPSVAYKECIAENERLGVQ